MAIYEQTVRSLVLGKWADYRPVIPDASVRFLRRDEYLDAARGDPTVSVELAAGWFCDFAAPDTLHGFGDEVIGQLAS